MILPIYAYGQPVLKKRADIIENDHEGLVELIENMWETMYNAEGVGLAAPQIGMSIRLFLVDTVQVMKDGEKEKGIKKAFINAEKKVYGMFYEVSGNAASQSQFYVTDSINHFVTGSLYFYAKPNYDSILPAAIYLQNDIRKIMESLEWKN